MSQHYTLNTVEVSRLRPQKRVRASASYTETKMRGTQIREPGGAFAPPKFGRPFLRPYNLEAP